MPYFKIGSGDITWKQSIERMASFGKPILLATGASNLQEVEDAVALIEQFNVPLILMQCNTNYTGGIENFDYIIADITNWYIDKGYTTTRVYIKQQNISKLG